MECRRPYTTLEKAMLKLPNDLLQTTTCNFIPESQQAPHPTLILEGFLRREELAQQFNLSIRTIDRWAALREGPPRVCVGRTILYNVNSVREWLRSREKQPSLMKKRRNSPRNNSYEHLPPNTRN
jgi:predicted DNA-binding transcriptional regulator AlpA